MRYKKSIYNYVQQNGEYYLIYNTLYNSLVRLSEEEYIKFSNIEDFEDELSSAFVENGLWVEKNINEKDYTQANTEITENSSTLTYSLEDIPEYSGTPYAILNNNKPEFTEKDYTTKSFENYSELDSLGRCGVAYANVCKEIMPPERR